MRCGENVTSGWLLDGMLLSLCIFMCLWFGVMYNFVANLPLSLTLYHSQLAHQRRCDCVGKGDKSIELNTKSTAKIKSKKYIHRWQQFECPFKACSRKSFDAGKRDRSERDEYSSIITYTVSRNEILILHFIYFAIHGCYLSLFVFALTVGYSTCTLMFINSHDHTPVCDCTQFTTRFPSNRTLKEQMSYHEVSKCPISWDCQLVQLSRSKLTIVNDDQNWRSITQLE